MSIFLYRMRIQWHKWLVYLIRRVQRFVLSFRFFFQTWAQASLTQKHFYWEYKASHESGVENLTFIDLFSSSFHQIEKYISLKEWIIPGCPEHIIESWSHAGTGTQYENSIKLLQISGKKTERKLFLFDSPSAATTMRTACDLLTHSLLHSHLSHFRLLHNTLDKFDEGRSMAVSVASSRSLYCLHILRDFKVVQVRVNCRFVWP